MSVTLTYLNKTIPFEDLSEARSKAYEILNTEDVKGLTITSENGRVDLYFANAFDINYLSAWAKN